MSWSEVAMAMVEKATVGSVGFTGLVAVLCIYGIIVGFLRVIQRMYIARQVRKGLANTNSRQVEKLIDELVEELE